MTSTISLACLFHGPGRRPGTPCRTCERTAPATRRTRHLVTVRSWPHARPGLTPGRASRQAGAHARPGLTPGGSAFLRHGDAAARLGRGHAELSGDLLCRVPLLVGERPVGQPDPDRL